MRINKFLAQNTNLSRRAADQAVADGRVIVNDRKANAGDQVIDDTVYLDGQKITVKNSETMTIVMNKPVGYVCSRNGQGNKTVYELLPKKYQQLNCVGRLDKASSGLLLFTNDGELANRLTHPSFGKVKIYEITLDKDLSPLHQQMINDIGINLNDGLSKLALEKLNDPKNFRVTMREGRNRQIRRTFEVLGYKVIRLHRTNFGDFALNNSTNTPNIQIV